MKKIILGLCLLCFCAPSFQNEALAHRSKGFKKHSRHHNAHHKSYKRHRPSRVVYVTPRTCLAPVRPVTYYTPYIGFGYSNFSSGYHFQVGFD